MLEGMEELMGVKFVYLFFDIKIEENIVVFVFVFDKKIDD